MPEATSSAAAFIDAIKTGEFDRVKQMISVEPTLIDAKSRTGESAILTAVYHRQKEIANLLVARAVARRKEQAIRTALGGGRRCLVRERLMESLLLSAAGDDWRLVEAELQSRREGLNRIRM